MKTTIVVSRKWTNPQIEAFLDAAGVGARMDLDAFLDALIEEVGNPTTLVTKAGLRTRLIAAKEAVIKELRDATTHVV